MLLSTASLAFCGLVRCLPLRQGFMVLVQLSMRAGGVEELELFGLENLLFFFFCGENDGRSWKRAMPKGLLDVEKKQESVLHLGLRSSEPS